MPLVRNKGFPMLESSGIPSNKLLSFKSLMGFINDVSKSKSFRAKIKNIFSYAYKHGFSEKQIEDLYLKALEEEIIKRKIQQ